MPWRKTSTSGSKSMSHEEQAAAAAKVIRHSAVCAIIASAEHPKKVVRMCVDFVGGQVKKITRYNHNNGEHTVSYVAGREDADET